MLSLPPEFSQGAVKLSYDPCVFLQLCTFHGVQSCIATDQAQITCVKKSRATVTYVLKLSHELKKKSPSKQHLSSSELSTAHENGVTPGAGNPDL